MRYRRQIVRSLKQVLTKKGFNYKDLSQRIGLSESSVKRIFSQESFTLDRLEEVCECLGISIFDLIEMAKGEADESYTYSAEQEADFIKDLQLYAFWDQLRSDVRPADLVAEDKFSQKQASSYLAQLEKMKLVEWLPGDEVKILVARGIQWRRGGALQRVFLQKAKKDFVEHSFADSNEMMRMSVVSVNNKEATLFQERLKKIHEEVLEVSQTESDSSNTDVKFGFLVAMRPWELDIAKLSKPTLKP